MAAEESAIVKTRVPESQKQRWTDHADGLEMSQSEFVRTMVQAGRRGFEIEPVERHSPDANPRGNALREAVLEELSPDEYREFDEVVAALHGEFERLADETLNALRDEGIVEFSNVDGYSLAGDSHGGD